MTDFQATSMCLRMLVAARSAGVVMALTRERQPWRWTRFSE
jgi:hypothetical protein